MDDGAQLKGCLGANNSPEAGTGTAASAQALELLQAAASDPLQGMVPLAVVKDKIAKITAGAHKLDAGAQQLQAGAGRLNEGAAQLHTGTGRLTAGFATLGERLNSRDPNNPGVVLGTELLAAGTSQIRIGMDGVPGNADRPADGNARIADGTGTLHTSAAAISPASRVGKSDTAVALGLVALLVLGSVGIHVVLWNRRKLQSAE